MVTEEAARMLVRLARESVESWVRGETLPPVPDHPALGALSGVFVSLHREGALRGCLGRLESDLPLGLATQRMAVAAARDDPRFPPLSADELEGLEIEVSVLSQPRRARPEEVEPGRHGVVLRHAGRQGVLLPQVASQYGWSRLELLDAVSRKAGLAQDAWRREESELLVFTAQVIGEHAPS